MGISEKGIDNAFNVSQMSKILLIVPGSRTFYGEPRYPACGLSMIGAMLLKAGHDVRALDMRFSKINDSDLLMEMESFQPSFVGFTATNWDVLESVRLAKKIKSVRPGTTIIFGGPQPTLCPVETLQYSAVDVVVRGEGELTILELIDALEQKCSLSEIAGLAYRNSHDIAEITADRSLIADLSKLPWPAYELFDLPLYYAFNERRLGIISTRGCPYGCIFCVGRKVMGRRIRCRKPADVVAEMVHWYNTCGITHFCFVEDNLLGNPRHGDELLFELEKAQLPVTYSLEVGVRADALTDDICKKLKETGCTIVAIGIESVDEDVLKLVNKGENLEAITRGIRAAKMAGLFVKGYFIVGLPGDTRKKVEQAIAYARREEIDMPRFALVQAFPHSELAEWVEKNGNFFYDPYDYTLTQTDEFHGDVHYDMPGFPKEEIWKTYMWAHDQAEAISFKQSLIRRFGKSIGNILNIINNKLSRRIVIWMYQQKLLSLPK